VTKKVGIIGYPLDHSLSPVFQQAAFNDLNLDVIYESWPLLPKEIPYFIENMKTQSILGVNVTIPYKEIIIDYLDDIDGDALSIGAVNTIVNTAGTLVGYNTDELGFSKTLSELMDLRLLNKSALILGSGGVARSALRTLIGNGFKNITIANRTESRAKKLVADFVNNEAIRINTICIEDDKLSAISKSASLIVNCTSLGMKHGESQNSSPLKYSDISKNSFVYDMVYNPIQTPLMNVANQAGAKAFSGLSMLIYQGVESFKLWTGMEPSFEVMLKAAEEALLID
jgi:shikimate dehydrogenase|tara:strand:- start:145 stop:999 length:855 start_codon:yes stop_codon:yes gene_type:complete